MAITEATLALVTRFANEFNTRDVDARVADMTEDYVFEHVAPAHAGFGRHEGAAAVRAVWASMDTHVSGSRRRSPVSSPRVIGRAAAG